jgi:hypothetical protein
VAVMFPKNIPYLPLQPIIIGCITYEFANSNRIHHTHFAYEVTRINPRDQFHPYLFNSESLPKTLKYIALLKYPDAKAHTVD